MTFNSARFIVSNTDYRKCPPADKPEYAFIGRSNVGKSSLINMLTNHKNLAKTSRKPGKTQLINHFLVNDKWYLVDLPGYGWAQVSKSQKAQWQKMIKDYLRYRSNLVLIFVLIDARHTPQTIDMDFIKWLGENQIPLALVLTKADKVSRNKIHSHRAAVEKRLQEDWEELPEIFLTSALQKTGKEEISQFIQSTSKNFYGI
ncbi:MAG: ribosome biogenesis GTP-binding protein YihA/YsxC [Cyclobacteriaceae bacterium]|nr:ribosome biogenesis GTP-binding protein YihA/YsxC [Cyclobacteriaceae bacterium]